MNKLIKYLLVVLMIVCISIGYQFNIKGFIIAGILLLFTFVLIKLEEAIKNYLNH